MNKSFSLTAKFIFLSTIVVMLISCEPAEDEFMSQKLLNIENMIEQNIDDPAGQVTFQSAMRFQFDNLKELIEEKCSDQVLIETEEGLEVKDRCEMEGTVIPELTKEECDAINWVDRRNYAGQSLYEKLSLVYPYNMTDEQFKTYIQLLYCQKKHL